MPKLDAPPQLPKEFETGGPFVLLATFKINPGKEDRVLEMLTANTKHARSGNEPGTISYRFYFSADRSTVVVYEEYADKAGMDIHDKSPTSPIFGKALMTEDLFAEIGVDFLREVHV